MCNAASAAPRSSGKSRRRHSVSAPASKPLDLSRLEAALSQSVDGSLSVATLAAATATGRHELLALVQNHPARLSVGPSVGGDLSIRLRGCGVVPAALRQPLAARVPLGGEGDQATHEGDEALIRKAAKVLKNPRVAGTAVEERLGFLRSKGLSEAQIAAALERAGLAEPR